MDWHIECEDVWKVFGADEHKALNDLRQEKLSKQTLRKRSGHAVGVAGVDLQIRRGELFCLMGLSGSGKSTLLRHINGLIHPTAGRVLVKGRDVAGLSEKDLRALRSTAVGMVFQHMALWPHRNLLDNVAYGLEIQGVDRKTRYAAARKMLSIMKLEAWEVSYPAELSGGMQQRVGIARALAADPDILLMDEPFSALDPLIRRELQTQFLQISRSLGKTTVFVTHDLEEAVRLGDRIAIMMDGEIVQVGTKKDIILHPANDYVRDFVGAISKREFLAAKDVMEPLCGEDGASRLSYGNCVDAKSNISQIVDELSSARETLGVTEDGKLIGCIEPYSLLRALDNV